jgi:GH18 family chitinase
MNSLDFLNVMTYDYHGGWERQVNFLHSWNDTLVRVGRGAGG